MITNITVVIPTLNSSKTLEDTLSNISKLVQNIIIVDANSNDKTIKIGKKYNSKIILSIPNRGQQLHVGAMKCTTDWILFLHSDSILSKNAHKEIKRFISFKSNKAGYFKLKFSDKNTYALIIEKIVYLRNVILKLPYGDQGLLISKSLYQNVGGFKPLPIMEDVNINLRIGYNNIKQINSYIITDSIKYKKYGWIKRPFFNLKCLILYFLKFDINKIYKEYYNDKQN